MVHKEGKQRGYKIGRNSLFSKLCSFLHLNTFNSKKAIGPVVATALLLVVAVVAVVGFQGWFQTFSSSMFVDVEQKSSASATNTQIETVIGSDLYFKNGNTGNITITSIKIGGIDCNISGNYAPGVQTIPLGNCTQNLSTQTPEIVIMTNNGILSKYVYFKDVTLSSPTYSSCTLDSITRNHGESYNFYNSTSVPFGQTCSYISRTCNDGNYSDDSSYNYSSCSALGQDTMPDSFSFTNQNDVALSSVITSNTIIPTDYEGPLSVGITGDGTPQLSINGGSWVNSGQMNPDDNLTIRLTSSSNGLTSFYANLTLGDYSTIWNVTTQLDCSGLCSCLNGGEWVTVPGNAALGTSDFCVMKWEAKNVGGIATSQPSLTPWVSISQTNAITACQNLGAGYDLINNAEWMTIARNVETVSANWADGTIGSTVASGGGLYRGNVNLNDAASCGSNVVLDGNTAGTNCFVSSRNKRELNLTTGEGIWDLSGNVREWNSDTIDCSGGYPCANMPYDSTPASEWIELTAINTYGSLSYDLTRPTNSIWNSDYGIGRLYTDANDAYLSGTTHAFLRGGDWASGAYAGAFARRLGNAPSFSSTYTGFRCSYTP